MKITNTVLTVLVLMMSACTSPKGNPDHVVKSEVASKRALASSNSLQGTFLAVADYVNHDRKPAVRIYLNPIIDEPGSYHAVLLEYANLLKVFPKYVASNKLEDLSEKIGFLNHIVEKVWLYKVVPSKEVGRFDMFELRASNTSVSAVKTKNPRQLVLSKNSNPAYALEGAKIYPSKTGHATQIFFPKKSAKSLVYGKEFKIAHLVYGQIGLDSTWKNKFLPGPYFSAYGNKKDIVLRLKKTEGSMQAYFNVNPDFVRLNLSRAEIEKREEVFTNPRSAFLEGGFIMREPVDGMFTFSPMFSNKNEQTIREITGHIGVFIDIFDASKKLNQDVVELITVNTEDPLDFHMHYEDPENGDGSTFDKSGVQ